MANLPINDHEFRQLTDFHCALYLWVADAGKSEGVPEQIRRDNLVRQYEENHKILHKNNIRPEYVLLKVAPHSERITQFRGCVEEASEAIGGFDARARTPLMFADALDMFKADCAKRPQEADTRETIILPRPDIQHRLDFLLKRQKGLNAKNAGENIFLSVQRFNKNYGNISMAFWEATRGTYFSDALTGDQITRPLEQLAVAVTMHDQRHKLDENEAHFLKNWLKHSKNIPVPEQPLTPDEALNNLDMALCTYNSLGDELKLSNERAAINKTMRTILREEMHVKDISRALRYQQTKSAASERTRG